jgi:hypothetical protein
VLRAGGRSMRGGKTLESKKSLGTGYNEGSEKSRENIKSRGSGYSMGIGNSLRSGSSPRSGDCSGRFDFVIRLSPHPVLEGEPQQVLPQVARFPWQHRRTHWSSRPRRPGAGYGCEDFETAGQRRDYAPGTC